jgi:hypothetical protein
MDWQSIDWKHFGPYVLPLVIVAVVARRLIRNPPRKVKVNSMFIMPVIAMAATVATIVYSPMAPSLFWMVGFLVALAAGAGVGFLSAHHQEFTLDADTGEVTSRATPIGTMLIGALFVLRFGLKMVFPQMGGGATPGHPSADVLAWTDAGLIFSTALLTARVATTWLRTRPLILAHRAQKDPAV